MAELLNKFKMLIGVEDIEDEDEEYEEPVMRAPEKKPAPVSQIGSSGTRSSSYNTPAPSRFDVPAYTRPVTMDSRDNKVVRMQSSSSRSQQMKLIVVEPEDIKESTKLVDSLKNGKPVIVNLERLESDKARKIFDFLSGAVYALDCGMSKVSNNIFVIAPDNVEIQTSAAREALAARNESLSPWRK